MSWSDIILLVSVFVLIVALIIYKFSRKNSIKFEFALLSI